MKWYLIMAKREPGTGGGEEGSGAAERNDAGDGAAIRGVQGRTEV